MIEIGLKAAKKETKHKTTTTQENIAMFCYVWLEIVISWI